MLRSQAKLAVLVSDEQHSNDRLFGDGSGSIRDDGLRHWRRLREQGETRGIEVHTLDSARDPDAIVSINTVIEDPPAPWFFYVGEPRVVRPDLYRQIDEIAGRAAFVFTHSYEIAAKGGNFCHYSYPVILPAPSSEYPTDRNLAVMMNANKRPRSWRGELYTSRLRIASYLAQREAIDVYGSGWDSTRKVYLWAPWTRRVRTRWKGNAESKHSTLANYDFCLAFENAVSPGYITEKVFDPMAVGCIPVYLGAPEISEIIPKGAFIDYREHGSPERLLAVMLQMTEDEKRLRREKMAEYLAGRAFSSRFGIDTWVTQLLDTVSAVLGPAPSIPHTDE